MKMKAFPNRRLQSGFTLMELMVTLPIALVLIGGAMDLFVNAARIESKTYAQMSSAADAANADQEIIEQVREAQWFTLAGEGAVTPEPAFTPAPGETDSDYETGSAATGIDYTAIELIMPPTMTPAEVGYTNSSFTAITVFNQSGGQIPASMSRTMSYPPYFRDGSPNAQPFILIYRGDPNGAPDPTSGGYLWQMTFSGNTVLSSEPLCTTLATAAANAVQFVRPFEDGEALPYQMDIKIITSAYSAINGVQTNEETDGTYSSELVGECALMRDHSTMAGSSSALTGAQQSNNTFKADTNPGQATAPGQATPPGKATAPGQATAPA